MVVVVVGVVVVVVVVIMSSPLRSSSRDRVCGALVVVYTVQPNRVLAAGTAPFFAVNTTRLVEATAMASAQRREIA